MSASPHAAHLVCMDIREARLRLLDADGSEIDPNQHEKVRYYVSDRPGDVKEIKVYSGLAEGVNGQHVTICPEQNDGDDRDLPWAHRVFDAKTWFNGSCLFIDGYQKNKDGSVQRVRWTLM